MHPSSSDHQSSIASNLSHVRARIEDAARRAHRNPADIRLIAISKTFDEGKIRDAYAAGQRAFGENRVQEALQKMDQLADLTIEWHLVGHLQSNKAKRSAQRFACIHSIDSLEVLTQIDEAALAAGKRPELFIQVNLADEVAKSGIDLVGLRPMVAAVERTSAARVTGLMVMPPYDPEPEAARPFFRQLRALRDRLIAEGSNPAMLRELSMGMSHDFEVAIDEGATVIRIGTAIFGKRTKAAE